MFHKTAAALALSLMSTASFAADLPSRAAPPVYAPPPIPAFTWTGFYIGGQAGYDFGRDNVYGAGNFSGGSPSGFIGGGHVGYNFSTQSLPLFGNAFGTGGVIGLEGDVDGTTARNGYSLGVINGSERDSIQGSIRGRLGFAADRMLFYITGGAAFGGLHNNYYNTVTALSDSVNHTRIGYTAGGGIEYAMTNSLSLRVEYRYTDLGGYNDYLTNSALSVHHHDTDNRVQAGFSYKFDSFLPAPVVARY